jgi:hypothetical protein
MCIFRPCTRRQVRIRRARAMLHQPLASIKVDLWFIVPPTAPSCAAKLRHDISSPSATMRTHPRLAGLVARCRSSKNPPSLQLSYLSQARSLTRLTEGRLKFAQPLSPASTLCRHVLADCKTGRTAFSTSLPSGLYEGENPPPGEGNAGAEAAKAGGKPGKDRHV